MNPCKNCGDWVAGHWCHVCQVKVDNKAAFPRHAISVPCSTCDGSGILNVEVMQYGSSEGVASCWEPEASWCHECPAGAFWRELLNEQ